MQKEQQPLRAVFMGTPQFAATILEHVLKSPLVEVVAVYAQPDRPAGRGKNLKEPEVKVLAKAHGLTVEQPLNFKDEADVARLASYKPDVLLVAAYGLILPQKVLDIPRLLPINVHASLLPHLRGAAPIQRAIMQGHVVTGISIMHMQAGLDSGPILLQRSLAIGLEDTSASLHEELAQMGGILLVESLATLAKGGLAGIEQDKARVSFAPKLAKEESLIDLRLSCTAIHALIRGLTPWPAASLMLRRDGHEDLKVQMTHGILPKTLFPSDEEKPRAGSILGLEGDNLLLATGDGAYALTSLCPAGKKPMTGRAFFNGYVASAHNAHFVIPE